MSAADIVAAATKVLVAHQRQTAQHCLCGWGELGRSHPEHVAKQLQAAGLLREVAR